MKSIIGLYLKLLNRLRDLPPLIFRLIIAYGFFEPAMKKWADINAVAQWFGESLHIPFPLANAYLAASTEALGIILLPIGLGVRFIGVPMMVTMVVAIATVHYKNGFACGHNGFEVPFYYFFILFSLVVGGAGRISLDWLIRKKVMGSDAQG